LLVLNDTRVLPARLIAARESGGQIELLLLSRDADGNWSALARPARRIRRGETLRLVAADGTRTAEAVHVVSNDHAEVKLRFDDERAIARQGRTPLPPYIRSALKDPERYQTVYAHAEGSAAAPTAGLHFTPELLERCRAAGIELARVTLHIGLDTFQPVRAEDARDHVIHSEWFALPGETRDAIRRAKNDGRRVVAVGTTSVRTLESSAGDILRCNASDPIERSTRLYITPGYRFEVVDAMLTNFHLPRTTLLLLVAAFAGEDVTRRAYAHAVAARYRFYSFGDAMLIV
jgi:S-adenosylmethionine:tRNA ribosyltransferase-isomerase